YIIELYVIRYVIGGYIKGKGSSTKEKVSSEFISKVVVKSSMKGVCQTGLCSYARREPRPCGRGCRSSWSGSFPCGRCGLGRRCRSAWSCSFSRGGCGLSRGGRRSTWGCSFPPGRCGLSRGGGSVWNCSFPCRGCWLSK